MTDLDDVVLEAHGPVLTLELNRPSSLNAINGPIEEGLRAAVDRLETDPDIAVLVISARGRYFCAGYDLRYRVDDVHDSGGVALRHRYRQIHDLFDRFEKVEKPTVAAIHAPCVGGGLEFALSCDFRLASEAANFTLPEITFGAVSGSGGVSRLTRLVGPGWARWLCMAGMTVDASRALQIGLVHEVYPSAEFAARVDAFAQHMASLPRDALGTTKVAIELAADLDRASARDVERLANTTLLSGADYQQRVTAKKRRILASDEGST
jgi:enoyl-CoA hydratase